MKTDFEIKLRDYKPQRIASIRAKTTIDKVTSKVSQLLQETSDYLDGLGVSPAGAGLAVYYEVGSFLVDVEVGFPINVEVPGNDRVQQNDLPGGKCAVALFQGPHADIADAHRAVHSWMHEHDIKSTGDPTREVYLTDLRNVPDGGDCEAESVWPVVHETRAEKRRQMRQKVSDTSNPTPSVG